MWLPGNAAKETGQAVLRSLCESFPYVRCFKSVQGWGVHLLGSMEPIEPFDAKQLAARMPESARQDLLEWSDLNNAPAVLDAVLRREIHVDRALDPDPEIRITDDKPFNEYYLLRHNLGLGKH
jgi:hypothetical protein